MIAGVSVFGLGLMLTALSGVLRAHLPLSSAELRSTYVLPRPTVSMLLFMIVFTLVLAQTAALHSAWWIRILITATTVGVMGLWGIRKPSLSYPGVVLSIGALMVTLLALVLVWAKFSYTWWECPAVLLLVGGSAVPSLIEDARGIANGVGLAPIFLQETMLSLGSLVVLVLFAAG